MRFVIAVGSVALIVLILVDAFEAVLLPRRVTHGYRLIRLYYRLTWGGWRRIAAAVTLQRRRQALFGLYGPFSLLVLFSTWAITLIVAFGLLHWSLQTSLAGPAASSNGDRSLWADFYFSGVTFFTLGYGDIVPSGAFARFLAVLEAGLGFGFLASVIGYLPLLTQAFSRREVSISLLDARAGSPPSAGQILVRCQTSRRPDALHAYLAEWEAWSAELLENCLSFPVLAFYRSQHDNQSWLAALTAILDTCALEICGLGSADPYQARLTFANARHAAVDLSLVFKITPVPPQPDRLPPEGMRQLRELLKSGGVSLSESTGMETRLAELRAMYEPFLNGLARGFELKMPGFMPEKPTADNWQTSAWMPKTPGIRDLPRLERGEHFD